MIFFFLKSDVIYSQNEDSSQYRTNEIKVFSNKITTDKFNSPSKVQVIDRVAIENKNGETLSEILQTASGVYVKSYGGSYSLNTISLNGLGSEHTLILLNGFKLNSSQNNQLDLNTISKDNIEEIEILNNGSSSIYGSEAIGGVVNIITKNNSLNDLKLAVGGQVGSYDQRKIYLSAEKRFKQFGLGINYSKERALNNYEYYFNTGAEYLLKERANSDYDISVYSADLSFSLKNSLIKYYSNYTDQFRNIPGIEAGSAPSNSDQRDMNWNNVLSYDNILSGNLSFKSQINFQNNLTHYFDGLFTKSYYKNIYASNSSQINFKKNTYEIISGYEINYATLKSNEIEGPVNRVQPSFFLVSQVKISEALKFFPSVRYDHISDLNKNVVSGKLGINVKPFKNEKLNMKASAGNNYASPTFNELYWKELGNKNLKPEKSFNADIGVIGNFNLFSDNTLELTYSYIDATDKIVWTPNSSGLYTPQNVGRSSSNVFLFDMNLKKGLSKKLAMNLNLNYSYTSSLKKSSNYTGDPTYNKQIFYIPENIAKSNLNIEYEDAGMNLYYTYTGKRFTNFENTEHLPAVNLFEGNIYKNFSFKGLNAGLKFEVNNLFDENYQIMSGYPMPLRNYKLILNLEY